MFAVATTLLLAAGFLFVAGWQITRILKLKDGQVIYLASIVAAVPIYFLAVYVAQGLSSTAIGSHAFRWLESIICLSDFFDGSYSVMPAVVGIVSIPISIALAALLNFPIQRNGGLLRLLYEHFGEGEPLDSILSEAAYQQLPVLVSLTTSKFYLGYPIRTELYGAANSQWIHLAPWFSGYRDSWQRLRFTTAYAPVLQAADEAQATNDPRFQVAIPLSSIASVLPFDMKIYQQQFSGQIDYAEPINEPLENSKRGDWRKEAINDAMRYGIALLLFACAVPVALVYPAVALLLAFAGATLLAIVSMPARH